MLGQVVIRSQITNALACQIQPHQLKLEFQGKLANPHHHTVRTAWTSTRYQAPINQTIDVSPWCLLLTLETAPRCEGERGVVIRF